MTTFCDNAKYNFGSYKKDGLVKQEHDTNYIVYEIENENGPITGLLCLIDYKDVITKIVEHEKTIIHKEKNVQQFLKENQSMIKPVLLAYQKNEAVHKLMMETKLTKPFKWYQYENEVHTFWKIDEKYQLELEKQFMQKVSETYIADGHHRTAVIESLLKQGFNFDSLGMFSLLVDFSQIKISSFTRIISTKEDLVLLMENYGKVEKGIKRDLQHLNFAQNELWYNFKFDKKWRVDKKSIIETFTEIIIVKEMKIENIQKTKKIKYIEGIDDIEQITPLTKKLNMKAILLPPLTVEEFVYISKMKKVLPPKSTYFFPRVRSGMVSCPF